MVNLTNPLQEVNMVTSPMLWSRPIPLGNDKDDDGDVGCDDEDDGYDEHGEHGDLADALVKMGNDDDDDAGYPAHSHQDIIPPWWDLVCNQSENLSVKKSYPWLFRVAQIVAALQPGCEEMERE